MNEPYDDVEALRAERDELSLDTPRSHEHPVGNGEKAVFSRVAPGITSSSDSRAPGTRGSWSL